MRENIKLKILAAQKTYKSCISAFTNISIISGVSFFMCAFIFASHAFANSQEENYELIKAEILQENLLYALDQSKLPLKDKVSELYQLRDNNLIWSNGNEFNQNAYELYDLIQNANNFGLKAEDYDEEIIHYFLETKIEDPVIISKSDVTFTHAYIKLAIHLKYGKQKISVNKEEISLLLEQLNLATNNYIVTAALEKLQPRNETYTNLLSAIKKYYKLEDPNERIVINKKSLTIGDRSNAIIELRKRLHDLGDYNGINFDSEILDESLAIAISNFQNRHGLEADGILGRKTIRELNRPIEDRIQQLELNLERARQLPDFKQGLHLYVNIPDYNLYLFENGRTIYESRVVVGKRKHKTPVLSSELTEFVLNPYWNIPKSIANNEFLPKIKENPDWLRDNNMKVLAKFNNKTQVINPDTIDWSMIDFWQSPLRIRQEPGAQNSLGRIKFLFPNAYSVYLHDTPARNLFAHTQRAFSHGCVRLEDPIGLAEVLLSSSNNAADNINYFLQRNKRKTIRFERPIPIHINYMTAWADSRGIVQFRPDIYKRDSQLASNLYNASH